jgi:hypothetical protein
MFQKILINFTAYTVAFFVKRNQKLITKQDIMEAPCVYDCKIRRLGLELYSIFESTAIGQRGQVTRMRK